VTIPVRVVPLPPATLPAALARRLMNSRRRKQEAIGRLPKVPVWPKGRGRPSRVEDRRGGLGHVATLRFLSSLISRVEDWRAGVGRSLCSLLSRPFVCECHTISTMPRFQPPPRRTQHADFLALRSPVCFASMLMGPILLERLSAAGGEPCSCRTAAGFRTTTAYSTVSSRSPFGSVPAPCGVESSFPPSLESC